MSVVSELVRCVSGVSNKKSTARVDSFLFLSSSESDACSFRRRDKNMAHYKLDPKHVKRVLKYAVLPKTDIGCS